MLRLDLPAQRTCLPCADLGKYSPMLCLGGVRDGKGGIDSAGSHGVLLVAERSA
jgi:hypothetical protein